MTGQSVAPHIIRNARETEIDSLARIWFDGWQDAHADILPAELARLRTLDSFRERLHTAIDTVRVAGPDGTPLGFSMVKGDELYQLYVSTRARGTGAAAALLASLLHDGVLTVEQIKADLRRRGVPVRPLVSA